MATPDVLGYQEGIYQAELSRKEKESDWLESRSDEIYNQLMNDEVITVRSESYSLDDIIEEVTLSDRFRALIIESLTHTETVGYDLRNMVSEQGEKLALELAQKEFNHAVVGF